MLGIIAFLVALLVLVLVHEYGHYKAARWFGVAVEEFGFGFPPRIVGKKIGETVFSLNWLPLGGFVRIKGEEDKVDDFDSFSSQSVWKRGLIIVAGVVMNLLLAVFLFTFGFTAGMPQELSEPASASAMVRSVKHQVIGVVPNSPAASVLQVGDAIERLDETIFADRTSLQQYIRAHDGEILVTFRRDDQVIMAPISPTEFQVPSGDTARGLGIELVTSGVVSYPIYEAPVRAVGMVATIFWLIATTLGGMLVQLFQGMPVSTDVAGPVGIAVISGQVASLGFIAYVQFLALLSINLAFVNLIPFPALDGGRLLFVIIEAVRRRPVSRELEMSLHRYGFLALLLLVLIVTYVDLQHLRVFSTAASHLRQLF